MSTRITKKLVTPFEMCEATGAILLVNLYDPQIPTLNLFREAIERAGLPFLIARLTGKALKVGDLPGTTLEFEEHEWNGRVLIDSVGQVIDL